MIKQGRNDPCACGSGEKFKQCCMSSAMAKNSTTSNNAAISNALKAASNFVSSGKLKDAVLICQQILQAEPNNHEALNLLGVLAYYDGNNSLAINCLRKAIIINPQYADAHNNIAEIYRSSCHFQQAISHFQQALKIKPNYIDALVNYGNVLQDIHEYEKSLDSYYQVLKINPKHAGSLNNIANLLQQLNRHNEALEILERLLLIDENYDWALGGRFFAKSNCYNWDNYRSDVDQILLKVEAGMNVIKPFDLLSISSDSKQQLAFTRQFANYQYPVRSERISAKPPLNRKVRVAYVSADFRQHPVAQLLVEVIERHDRSKFEIIGVSLGVDDKSQIRARIAKAFDQFHEVKESSDFEVAQLLKNLNVDIVIDLMGYTTGARMGIFSYRPAPIQIGFLGYAGTTGTDYIDYIIADKVVIPDNQSSNFSEKIIRLQNTFFPRDTKSAPQINIPTRSEENLPEDAFVFCSFNNHYKINPQMFDIWMRLLGNVEGSVLWLSKANNVAKVNLIKEAESRGVCANRIIFAERTERLEDHLARHQLADLFLDTYPYNAHTTASDALWAGLPVLTYIGNTFASRVAASMLYAAEMDELVVDNLVRYEELALKIAKHANYSKSLKSKLKKNKIKSAVFNTKQYTESLEKEFLTLANKSYGINH